LVQAAAKKHRPSPAQKDLPFGTRGKKLTTAGTFMLAEVHYGRRGQV
jgi:putative transposase